jgi:hypothetical protein
MTTLTKEYIEGVLDGVFETLLFTELYVIEAEKYFEYSVKQKENKFILYLSYIEYYKESKFKGDYFNPPDPDEPIYNNTQKVFSNKENIKTIVAYFVDCLEEISNHEIKLI